MDGMNASPAVVAGIISSLVFAGSALPMLVKAHRTKDLQSYSLGNLVLVNAGNAVHTLYVVSLPFGPIWFLHSFYTVSSLAMLGYYLRHARGAQGSSIGAPGGGALAAMPPTSHTKGRGAAWPSSSPGWESPERTWSTRSGSPNRDPFHGGGAGRGCLAGIPADVCRPGGPMAKPSLATPAMRMTP